MNFFYGHLSKIVLLKSLGLLMASVMMASLFVFIQNPAARADSNPAPAQPAVPVNADLPPRPTLTTLMLEKNAVPGSSLFTVSLGSDTPPVSPETPITISDSLTGETLATCVNPEDCSVQVDPSAHPVLQAASGLVASKKLYFDESLKPVENPQVPAGTSFNTATNGKTEEQLQVSTPAPVSTTGWGIDVGITNPIFASNESYRISMQANKTFDWTNYAIYLTDPSTGSITTTIPGFRIGASGENTWGTSASYNFKGPEETRSYKAYVGTYDDAATNISEVQGIQAESGVVTAYRSPWEVNLTQRNPIFEATGGVNEQPEKPYVAARSNQEMSNSGYGIYLFNTTTGALYSSNSYSGTSTGGYVNFEVGGSQQYKAYIAKQNYDVQSVSDLEDIQAESGAATFTRKAWKVAINYRVLNVDQSKMEVIPTYTSDQVQEYSGYDYVTHNLTTNEWYVSRGSSGSVRSDVFDVPNDTTNFIKTYVGIPSGDPGDRYGVTGVTDIQAVSNTLMIRNNAKQSNNGLATAETTGGSNPSEECAQACAADPINTATGEFWENNTDVSLPNVGVPLQFVRSNASQQNTKETDFGTNGGWTHNYNMKLKDSASDSTANLWEKPALTIVQENGSAVEFLRTENGTYLAPSAVQAQLDYSSDEDTFTMTRNNGAKFVFSSVDGKLLTQADPKGNKLVLSYNGSRKISKISADNGNFIEVNYAGGEISSVEDSSGYRVTYSYVNGRLSEVKDSVGLLKAYTYNGAGQVETMKDAVNATVTNAYNSEGKISSQTDEKGGVTRFNYALVNSSYPKVFSTVVTNPDNSKIYQEYKAGQLVKEVKGYQSGSEQTWAYTYDAASNLLKVVNPDGSTVTSTYDVYGNVTARQDELGRITRTSYDYSNEDTKNNPLQIVAPSDETTTFTYNADGTVASVSDALGRATNVEYNPNGTTHRTISPSGQTTTYRYDSKNNVSEIEAADGAKTQYEYDASANIVETTNPLGNTTTAVYDSRGNQTSVTDAEGNETVTEYNKLSQSTKITDAQGNTTKAEYDALGNIVKVIDQIGYETVSEYDSMGRTTKVSEPYTMWDFEDLSSVQYSYDTFGNQIKTTDPNGNESNYEYNYRGQPTKMTLPSGKTSYIVYDAAGQKIESYDGNNNKTSYEYDSLGRLVASVDAAGKRSTVTYDSNSNPISQTRTDGSTESWAYDLEGQKTSYTNAAGQVASYGYNNVNQLVSSNVNGINDSYEYDAAGNLTQKQRGSNSPVNYEYNSRGLMTEVDYADPGTTDVQYEYDSLGQRVSITDASGTKNYNYTERGELASINQGDEHLVIYNYTPNGLQDIIGGVPGRYEGRTYDKAGNMVSVDDDAIGVTNYTYDVDGNNTKVEYPNSVKAEYAYDNNGATTKIKYSNSTETLLEQDYSYNNINLLTGENVVSETANPPKVNAYAYDALNRIQTVNGENYAFDPLHSVTDKTNGDALSYNTKSQLTSLDNTVDSKTSSFAYDNAGNRTNETTLTSGVSDTNDYTYNAADQLVEAQLGANPPPGNAADTTELAYTYDGNGLRVSKETTENNRTSTEEFLWDTSSSVPLLREDNDYLYSYGLGTSPVAQVDKTTGTVEYLHGDNIGSVKLVTDDEGNKVTTYDYDEFGNQTEGEANHNKTAFGYAGEYLDKDTGYYYLRARWYDPATAQFTSVDPKLLTTNLPYAYTAGNPLQYTDPLGLDALSDVGSFSLGALDGLSGGLSTWAVNAIKPGTIDTCSSAFKWGSGVGTVASFIIPGGAVVKAAGAVAAVGFGVFKGVTKLARVIKNSNLVKKVTSSVAGARSSEAGAVILHTPSFGQSGRITKKIWAAEAAKGNIMFLGGTYGELKGISSSLRKKYGVEIHHMPMDSLHKYSRNEGPAVIILASDHAKTRTWRSRAKPLLITDRHRSISDLASTDIKDLLVNTPGGKKGLYDDGIRQAISTTDLSSVHGLTPGQFGL